MLFPARGLIPLLAAASARCSVLTLDSAGVVEMMESSRNAFVCFEPADCSVCAQLAPFWAQVGQQWPGVVRRVECGNSKSCERALGALPTALVQLAHGKPVFAIWAGASWDLYAGSSNAEEVVRFLQERGGEWQAGQEARARGGLLEPPLQDLLQRNRPKGTSLPSASPPAPGDAATADARVPIIRQIPRLYSPSFGTFRARHLVPSVPAIVGGALSDWGAMRWDWDHLSARCGERAMGPRCSHNSVTLFDAEQGAALWAGAREVKTRALGVTRVKDMLQRQQQGEPLYLHDAAIELFCPALMADVKAPQYFPVDYLQAVPAALRFTSHSCPGHASSLVPPSTHPSIFIGPRGTRSALHADDHGSRFMMALFRGRKHFRLLNATDAERCLGALPPLGASYPYKFDLDPFSPKPGQLHEVGADGAKCVLWEGELGPGDLIFIPEEWPHAVVNMDDSIAISYNFVDDWSTASFLRYHASRMSAVDPRGPITTPLEHRRALAVAASALAEHLLRDGWGFQGEGNPLDPQLLSALILATFATMQAPLPDARSLPAERLDVAWRDFFAQQRLDHTRDLPQYTARVRAWLASEAFMSLNASDLSPLQQASAFGWPAPAHSAERFSSGMPHDEL